MGLFFATLTPILFLINGLNSDSEVLILIVEQLNNLMSERGKGVECSWALVKETYNVAQSERIVYIMLNISKKKKNE